jgi:hypothetical protein
MKKARAKTQRRQAGLVTWSEREDASLQILFEAFASLREIFATFAKNWPSANAAENAGKM